NASEALGHHTEAASLFTELIARFPKNKLAARAQLKSGDALLAAAQPEQAAAAFQKTLDNYPDAPEAREARTALADLVDSTVDAGQLAVVIPHVPSEDRPHATVRLVRLYLQSKKYAEAEATAAQLVKQAPEQHAGEASYLLGLAAEAQQKHAPATVAL